PFGEQAGVVRLAIPHLRNRQFQFPHPRPEPSGLVAVAVALADFAPLMPICSKMILNLHLHHLPHQHLKELLEALFLAENFLNQLTQTVDIHSSHRSSPRSKSSLQTFDRCERWLS